MAVRLQKQQLKQTTKTKKMIANSNMFKLNPEYFEKTVIMQEENFPKQVDIFLEVYRAPPFPYQNVSLHQLSRVCYQGKKYLQTILDKKTCRNTKSNF